ncbi:unnamed protein product [Boreogadus saida]
MTTSTPADMTSYRTWLERSSVEKNVFPANASSDRGTRAEANEQLLIHVHKAQLTCIDHWVPLQGLYHGLTEPHSSRAFHLGAISKQTPNSLVCIAPNRKDIPKAASHPLGFTERLPSFLHYGVIYTLETREPLRTNQPQVLRLHNSYFLEPPPLHRCLTFDLSSYLFRRLDEQAVPFSS